MNATAATVEAARQALFGDVLACDETLPAAFVPGAVAAQLQRLHLAQAEGLLRALAVVEDSGRHEEPDPHMDAVFRRLEAKIDLLTALVAGFAASHSADDVRSLRWSARGVRLVADTGDVGPGTPGLFRMQPADWLPSPLTLPATVLAVESPAGPGQRALWLRFAPLGAALEAALERHLFRVHRRAVAESRRNG